MNIKQVNLILFSPTNGTRKVVRGVAAGTGLPIVEVDFTILRSAPAAPEFGSDELVVIGLPVYVGRVPKVALPYLQTLRGSDTPCILVGTYGNRHYDDMLVELEDLVQEQGFVPVGAAIFAAQHSFSDELAAGRPDSEDIQCAESFGGQVLEKLLACDKAVALEPGKIPGGRPYRIPYNSDKPRVVFGPVVSDSCINCGKCAQSCPSGAIHPDKVRDISAEKCIRCRACARVCPVAAIEMENPGFWEHTAYLLREFGTQSPEPVLVL